jgi:ribosomal protein S18 acetylase RimI-like enzyme
MTDSIRRATVADVDLVAPLFDAYRQFYKLPSNLALSRDFLAARLSRNESIVLLAQSSDGTPVGFVQLYSSFSSLRAAPNYILNDLFVSPAARGRGVGRLLMEAAADTARAAGAAGMTLSTAVTNTTAQALYESLGWKRETSFYEYNLDL